MALEVELKLALSPHHVESLKQQPLFRSGEVKELGTQLLKNTYYDTPEHSLSQNRVALRIREKGEQLIQTLKTSGTSEAGMHARKEWEWLLRKPELELGLLAKAEWPKALQNREIESRLAPVFTTNFQRTTWILDSHDKHGQPLKVEIALDLGEVSYQADAETTTDPLCELELELLEGDANGMLCFALDLARHVPLCISDISKAQRGYRLHDPASFTMRSRSFSATPEHTMEESFIALIGNELASWPSRFEAWQFNQDWSYITQALESLRNISALYETFSDIIPAEPDGVIDQLLTRLIRQLRDLDAWRRTADLCNGAGTEWHAQQEKKAAARMAVLLQTTEPGVLALLISQQLIDRSWRQRWTDAHRDRASQPLNRD